MLRAAVTGDYFLTAIPIGEDAERIRKIQSEIASATGGVVEEYVHLTLQRFEIDDGSAATETTILDAVEEAIADSEPPEVVAVGLFVTFHRYFQKHSVRWRIESTPELGRMTLQSAQAIIHHGARSHWPNAEASLSQFMTAAWLPDETELANELTRDLPTCLMSVRRVEVTRLVGDQKFDILRSFDIRG